MHGKSNSHSQAYYPIRIVSAETGVNTITLRAWERRYGLISPKRTAKGHRLYTEDDIQLIKKIVTLLGRGIPISQAQAMVKDGTSELEAPTLSSSRPSQWQHYREQLQIAVNDFDDQLLNSIFEEVGQFFPIDVSIRLLFVPFYRQLVQDKTLESGFAKLAFFTAFIESRMAWRLSATESDQTQRKVLLVNCSNASEVELLLLGLTIKQLGIAVTRLSGLNSADQVSRLLEQRKQWDAALIQFKVCPPDAVLGSLRSASAATGCPIFVIGLDESDYPALRNASLIPLSEETHQDAANIRDMIMGAQPE